MIPLTMQRWAINRLNTLATRLTRGQPLAPHLQTGLRGEREAFFHLRERGYTVVARRWASPRVRGDIDLVAWHRDVLCFVEVKSRSTRDEIFTAESAVDQPKRKQLRRLAHAYLKSLDAPEDIAVATRFDVLSVYLLPERPVFELIQAAFAWSEPSSTRW
jgi:putative endonuclease